MEKAIGEENFWKLLGGVGTLGNFVDLVSASDADFRQAFLHRCADQKPELLTALVKRSSFFDLARFSVKFTGTEPLHKLFKIIQLTGLDVFEKSSWYERNTGIRHIQKISGVVELNELLSEISHRLDSTDPHKIEFSSWKEAIDGLDLLYMQCEATRKTLATSFWSFFDDFSTWHLDPKSDMGLPKILLHIVSQPEFSSKDVEKAIVLIDKSLTPKVLRKSRTVDLLWVGWALYSTLVIKDPTVNNVSTQFTTSLGRKLEETLEDRVASKFNRNELRARFALLGLLGLAGHQVQDKIKHTLARSVRRGFGTLVRDQTFVTTYLIIKGVSEAENSDHFKNPMIRSDLIQKAKEYDALDAGADWLLKSLNK